MIYPSITTTHGSNWKQMIEDARELKLEEVCVFFTGLCRERREELFQLLVKTSIKRIPLAHIKTEMRPEELAFLDSHFEVSAFNIHPLKQYPFSYDYSSYLKRVYIENVIIPLEPEELKNVAGICLDVSHLENERLNNKSRYEKDRKTMKEFPIGCCHVSSIRKTPQEDEELSELNYSYHQFKELKEFDYLVRYKDILPLICAMELENPLSEQLEAIEYINRLLYN